MSDDDVLFWRLFALIPCLPELPPPRLLGWLGDGDEASLEADRLASLTQTALAARFPLDADAMTPARWRTVMDCLRGVLPAHLAVAAPARRRPQLLAAFASQDGLTINGHFGQCRLFFIYAFDQDGSWLHDLRRYQPAGGEQEGNEVRSALLNDCHLLFCEAIGGPAAARIIRHNIHPVKVAPGSQIQPQRDALQTLLAGTLPPWLAKRLEKGNPLENRVF
ncbi:nitrogen fixation protein NifY [Dickeya dianthicola]|uniref:NifB/NifX family molybdenum-iron cluster-binding protein n=1 Tax=Dickeya dianthicola TaxID=204039 RepID=UPI001BDE5808|nr:NifB/NifX family molybdenum-iron cluster-binding protein [Dickeya dianthicola]MBT1429692.1 nitrogen fixation protein NifY [Dickeya dianthicola]MBT1461209.1 nitrogen fixation protein NifY [Dickeya dianthicola]MBT1490402.1 nitrogen fixation protein NifY [Dickeya dianthicola]MBT1490403.1 nitrogen fixation protein NifY [Dickeya dianthicola]